MYARILGMAILSGALVGCGRGEQAKNQEKPAIAPGTILAMPPDIIGVKPPAIDATPPAPPFAVVDPNREKYDAALTQALTFLAERKYPQALESFETAKSVKDDPFVRGEIDRLKSRMEQDASAQKTVHEIEIVLAQGKASEASLLVTKALNQFGDRDVAPKLAEFRVQADALSALEKKEPEAARFQRLRDEGMAALSEKNLRAAAIAFEQALQIQNDPTTRGQLADAQAKLHNYDSLRQRADELRRDPARLEEAIDLLREAAKAWDTLQVRQDIDDATLALQKRRDNLSVAEFEVGDGIGFGDAGKVVADELLPHFKTRFDLVERTQIGKVVAELKLDVGFQNDPTQQREVGQLARVRFLVLGSVRRFGDIIVQARLVDARSGLIVQTGRIEADTIDSLRLKLPELSRQLLMSDAEKLAYDQQQIQTARKIAPIAENAPFPLPPATGEPPPSGPVFGYAPPPAFGGVTIAQYQAIPPPTTIVQTVILLEPPAPRLRHGLLHVTLDLGDGLFRRGHFREAMRHFEFALTLAPSDFDVRLRLERCRPMLPPPMPVFVVRPRLALLNFLVVGDPRVVPPMLSSWTPDALAPYLRANYDVVDQGEVFWMMGRLGLTLGDLMNDPGARRWLGRALHAEFFLMGTIEQTASFNVTTYLLNAEYGTLQGSGRLHAFDPFDLRMRLGELAMVTQMPAATRVQYVAQANNYDQLLTRGNDCMNRREYPVAIKVYEDALRLRPGNMQVIVYLNRARDAQRIWEMEEVRRQEFARRQAMEEEARRRQFELAREAEAARILAAQRYGLMAEADRRSREEQRMAASGGLVGQARIAFEGKNFALAINLFQGAMNLSPSHPVNGPPPVYLVAPPVPHDVLLRELAQAKAEAARAQQAQAEAEQVAARETALRQQREQEAIRAQARLAEERRRSEAASLAQQNELQVKYQAAFDQGQLLMSQGKYESAIVAVQAARQIKATPPVEALINTALQRQAQQTAKTEAEREAIDKKLFAENERRIQAEADAKAKKEQYDASLRAAENAIAAKNLDAAKTKLSASAT